ncbi:MAG: c-type cytochrome [Campylobacteraceae bacterium]|nr:c-type cytochrome [Campylobacteraceae bacterium]
MLLRPIFLISLAFLFLACENKAQIKIIDTKKEELSLGRALYFDKNLSLNKTQSCATCHNPEAGFVDDRDNGVQAQASLGDNGTSIGDRQAPSAAYAMFSPSFHYDKKKKEYIGGQFWDGREKTLAGQAGGPPTNPDEMAMPSKSAIVRRLKENLFYVEIFKKVYGENIFKNDDTAYLKMTKAIEVFEQSDFFAPFDSKYDRYLEGRYDLTPLEDLGRSLFYSNANTNCSSCHTLKKEDQKRETFSNYEFHNIGTPINTALRAKNGVRKKDDGLLNNPLVKDIKHQGKYKVPTLRNVAITSPYMHNGVFSDLKTVILFYDKFNNKKNIINPETNKAWRNAEWENTINKKDLKMKKLSERKVDALVAFLKLLTDKRYEHLLLKK